MLLGARPPLLPQVHLPLIVRARSARAPARLPRSLAQTGDREWELFDRERERLAERVGRRGGGDRERLKHA